MSTVQAIAGILLVFGLLALFYWMAYRYTGGRGFPGRSSRIEILETRGIGDKRALLLVKVGSDTFLVGSTTHQISLLSPIDVPPLLEEAAHEDPLRPPESSCAAALREDGSSVSEPSNALGAGLSGVLSGRPNFRAFLEMFR